MFNGKPAARMKKNTNYLCFGKPHRLKSDERKKEQKEEWNTSGKV